jgi:acyl dehydratase
MSTLTYDDFSSGDVYELGDHTVTKHEIVEFATEYDPQPFHVDEAAAEESIYGGLVASGWQTTAVMTRLLVRDMFGDVAACGGLGVDDLRWPTPVRPGDTLSATVRVVGTRVSESYDDRGYVDFEMVLENQRGDVVLSMVNHQIIRRETPDG